MRVLESFFPHWRELNIHETSPVSRGASNRLAQECKSYIPSHFFPELPAGELRNGIRSENMEQLSFADESLDIHISQDVMEHIFHPERAFSEIARTLKPGGAHIFTVPIVNRNNPTRQRAKISSDGQVIHVEAPQYHGNPIDPNGSLVTFDWGYDICGKIFESSGLFTYVIQIDDLTNGIRAEYIDVLVTKKAI